jgi:hypothetical protein
MGGFVRQLDALTRRSLSTIAHSDTEMQKRPKISVMRPGIRPSIARPVRHADLSVSAGAPSSSVKLR